MPGPRMGERPADFDEALVKQSPTYAKWSMMREGEKLRYACREFVKGHGDDEERLLRRIMIARRNNIKDHEKLKRARGTSAQQQQQTTMTTRGGATPEEQPNNNKEKKRKLAASMTDEQIEKEMDVPAVMATRSYRKWTSLKAGEELIYNQKYIKGKEGHDWLLRKNIWRRMRYRRENKKIMYSYDHKGNNKTEDLSSAAAGIVDHALLSSATGEHHAAAFDDKNGADAAAVDAVVESALAAADSYVKAENLGMVGVPVHNPLDNNNAPTMNEALDAAAKIAAAIEDHETNALADVAQV